MRLIQEESVSGDWSATGASWIRVLNTKVNGVENKKKRGRRGGGILHLISDHDEVGDQGRVDWIAIARIRHTFLFVLPDQTCH